jgi:predicted HicB family RNase H-like nuclease
MATSEAMMRASKKYISEKLDEVKFRVPKGQREVIRNHALTQGESVNAFLNRAVKETMERDTSQV